MVAVVRTLKVESTVVTCDVGHFFVADRTLYVASIFLKLLVVFALGTITAKTQLC